MCCLPNLRFLMGFDSISRVFKKKPTKPPFSFYNLLLFFYIRFFIFLEILTVFLYLFLIT